MAGWIKLHRKTLDNPIVCKDSDHLAVWVYLLLSATHDEYPALFQGKKIILQPGQLITGRKSISEKLNIAESKVQRIINSLKSEQQIEQQTSNHNRLITIVNWSEYQRGEQQNEQPVNNQRTTSEQPVNTNNKEKKDKKENKEIYTSEFLQFYSAYPKHIGKEPAWKAWQKRNGDLPDIKTLLQKIENQKNTENWKKENGAFIPHPATWLNNARWEDEVIVKQKDLW